MAAQEPVRVPLHVAWRPAAPKSQRVRARILDELNQLGWTLSQMEAMLYDASQASGVQHPWLLPKLELRLPIYDLRRRFRLVATCLERPAWRLEDARGRLVADITLP